jgi:hypothetical protein
MQHAVQSLLISYTKLKEDDHVLQFRLRWLRHGTFGCLWSILFLHEALKEIT